MSKPTPVLEARGLIKRYGHVTALDGADFEVMPGEIMAIIGDNGAGKPVLGGCHQGRGQPLRIAVYGKPEQQQLHEGNAKHHRECDPVAAHLDHFLGQQCP